MKWQYKVLSFEIENGEIHNLEKVLDKYGEYGWEAFQIDRVIDTDTYWIMFKMPKPDEL